MLTFERDRKQANLVSSFGIIEFLFVKYFHCNIHWVIFFNTAYKWYDLYLNIHQVRIILANIFLLLLL